MNYVAVGFFKNDRRYLGLDEVRGTAIIVPDLNKATRMTQEQASLAALVMGLRYNLAHCRGVRENEAPNVVPS